MIIRLIFLYPLCHLNFNAAIYHYNWYLRYRMKFVNTAYVIGNLTRNPKKDVRALFDIDYYESGDIDIVDDDTKILAKFNNGTKGLKYDYDNDKDNNMNTMNINMNLKINIYFYNNHNHHNNHCSNRSLK